ncbi:hypothetical protein QP028_14830 [Corynebacterium suedekumii]|nr:hypothetical protein QP028_14830 [Corynebacterium suedekumii]
MTLNSLPHHDPLAGYLADVTTLHLAVDIPAAQAYAGMTVRIGYPGVNERKAAMVEAIRASCEPAGITVVDASAEAGSLSDLTRVTTGRWGEQIIHEGALDAVLMGIDPMAEIDAPSARATEVDHLRSVESTSVGGGADDPARSAAPTIRDRPHSR